MVKALEAGPAGVSLEAGAAAVVGLEFGAGS